jgi:uncharacterized membrane protein YeiH
VVFLLYKPVENIPTWLFNGLDAVGLSLFVVAASPYASSASGSTGICHSTEPNSQG